MTVPVKARVQKYRDALRRSGLRPVQIWVPDTRRPGFAQECRRQCLLVTQADAADTQLQRLMDEALAEIDGWQA
ncbi:antitoxin MazE family protein [Hydrogenophilus thermoluteolus]|uniref:Antitoxin MazE n=1 Tax=Hydrogenophilus thermoluteolus TaxID=297 RepID=A0A2Z6E186_HYDTE|nr:antitoxin MazE family protein [Hydrogenophilus thermoluteolus]BBD78359.1 hypothetical protein HPTL_P014 [Hydrogenophilus thermoluteolus]